MTRMSAKEKLRSYPGCRRFISLGLTQHKNQPPMDIDEHKFIFLSFHFNFNPCVTVSVDGESLLLSISPTSHLRNQFIAARFRLRGGALLADEFRLQIV